MAYADETEVAVKFSTPYGKRYRRDFMRAVAEAKRRDGYFMPSEKAWYLTLANAARLESSLPSSVTVTIDDPAYREYKRDTGRTAENNPPPVPEYVRSSTEAVTVDEYPAPEGMSYYPHQEEAIDRILSRQSSYIADDMGLGKTATALGAINALGDRGERALIVVPNHLQSNWADEAELCIV